MREMCQTFGITALGETVESWTLKNEFLTAEVLTAQRCGGWYSAA